MIAAQFLAIDEVKAIPITDTVTGMTLPAYHLRAARADDFEPLYAIFVETMREYIDAVWEWNDDEQRDIFSRNFRLERIQVVMIDDKIAGWVVSDIRDGELFLLNIQVVPQWQGGGLGSDLIELMKASALRQNLPLSLTVFHGNDRAYRLYKRLGFMEMSRNEISKKMVFLPANLIVTDNIV